MPRSTIVLIGDSGVDGADQVVYNPNPQYSAPVIESRKTIHTRAKCLSRLILSSTDPQSGRGEAKRGGGAFVS